MRLDLHTSGTPGFVRGRALLETNIYGCADCGEWFQFHRELVQHILHDCPERDYE